MELKSFITLTILFGLFVSCGEKTVETNESVVKTTESAPSLSTEEIQVTVKNIDKLRSDIEAQDIAPIEIATENLREKVKQKWSKFHFYLKGDDVIRIKAYPNEPSKRTEECYLEGGNLALAVIEDDGSGAKGKPLDQLDKIYYFQNGELIKEVNNTSEEEFTVNKSDAEELIQEVNEYLSILRNNKTK